MKNTKKMYNYPITIPMHMREELLLVARFESEISELSFNKSVELAIKTFIKNNMPKLLKQQRNQAKTFAEPTSLFAGV